MLDTYQARLSRSKYVSLATDVAFKYNLSNETMYQLSHLLSSIDKEVNEYDFLIQCAHNYGKAWTPIKV